MIIFATTLIYNTAKIMKDESKTSILPNEGQRMTLKGYYKSLPDSTHPKTEFINEITKRTGVSFTAARNWVIYGTKPTAPYINLTINNIPTATLYRVANNYQNAAFNVNLSIWKIIKSKNRLSSNREN